MTDAAGDSGSEGPPAADKFYRGTIEKLLRGNEKGVIRSASGREFPFFFQHVLLVGEVVRCEDLSEGMPVGFDVGQTASGLVATVIHTGR